MKVLMIDNYDSFTYNLVQYLGELEVEVEVIRNDECSIAAVQANNASHIMLSPGPCTPNEAGISMQVVHTMAQEKPILGVCLGHQCIGQVFGGKIVRAREIVHGKTSQIYHDNSGVFSGLELPFTATRYHSLVIEESSLPDCLTITAWTCTDTGARDHIMGIHHKQYPLCGVQFHPESILTTHGHQLLQNFLTMTA